MQDIIFWGRSYPKFLAEALVKSPQLVTTIAGTGEHKLLFDAVPIVTNTHGEFMLLVRASDGTIGLFARCSTITNLGAYIAVLNSAPKREVYDRIYPQTPYEVIGMDGDTTTVTPPEKFGEFGS